MIPQIPVVLAHEEMRGWHLMFCEQKQSNESDLCLEMKINFTRTPYSLSCFTHGMYRRGCRGWSLKLSPSCIVFTVNRQEIVKVHHCLYLFTRTLMGHGGSIHLQLQINANLDASIGLTLYLSLLPLPE